MVKVYLLLRNNKQSGPYSLEELAHQQLKPLDLIWIEGRSAAWKYASEVTELRSYLPPSGDIAGTEKSKDSHEAYLPKTANVATGNAEQTPKKVYVSLPSNAGKKQEVAASVSPVLQPQTPVYQEQQPEQPKAQPEKEKLVTKYSSSLEEKEEVYTQWIYNKKSRKTSLAPEWIGGIAMVILLLMGSAAYYIKNKTADTAELTQLTPSDTRAVEELTSTTPEPLTSDEIPAQTSAGSEPAPEAVAPVPQNSASTNSATPANTPVQPKQKLSQAVNATKSKTAVSQNATISQPVTIREEPKITETSIEQPASNGSVRTSKTMAETSESKEKKKSFTEKVDGFFNKLVHAKKVEAGVPAGTTEPPTNDGDRKAIRRGDAPVVETPVKKDLTAGVQLTTIEPTGTWMQGVHGLRMKIENKNDVKVNNASVEVKYLNDQNAVIDKKTIRLNAIAPGKQITMDIPDHRLADHAVATLLSAEN